MTSLRKRAPLRPQGRCPASRPAGSAGLRPAGAGTGRTAEARRFNSLPLCERSPRSKVRQRPCSPVVPGIVQRGLPAACRLWNEKAGRVQRKKPRQGSGSSVNPPCGLRRRCGCHGGRAREMLDGPCAGSTRWRTAPPANAQATRARPALRRGCARAARTRLRRRSAQEPPRPGDHMRPPPACPQHRGTHETTSIVQSFRNDSLFRADWMRGTVAFVTFAFDFE